MKIQDMVFIVALAGLTIFRRPKLFIVVGLLCLLAAIPLFYKWIFFTAERLTWYAAGLFSFAIIWLCIRSFYLQKK